MINASAEASAPVAAKTLAKINCRYTTREAAFFSVIHSNLVYIRRLLELRTGEWRNLLHWLDVSGLTLYFADRVSEPNDGSLLPAFITDRLQQNLADNRGRISSLLEECTSIQAAFQRSHIIYALLKGFSLYPSSVPKLELRHQLDLDFVVDESCAPEARHVLERSGYRLYAINGGSWEFKKGEVPRFSTQTMYKAGFGHTVELHIDRVQPWHDSVLSRVEHREIEGMNMPMLSPADLFLHQALHVFKDLCSPFVRASHLLELYRHVCSRRDNAVFWFRLRELAERNPTSIPRLGVSLRLMESMMALEIPKEVAAWTTCHIPEGVHRWIDVHGRRNLYGTPPGTKLYLILRREMESTGLPFGRSIGQAILPRRLPPMIIVAGSNDMLTLRMNGCFLQFRFIFMRMRFHVVEGIRYGWESYRWRRRVTGSGEIVQKTSKLPREFSTKQ